MIRTGPCSGAAHVDPVRHHVVLDLATGSAIRLRAMHCLGAGDPRLALLEPTCHVARATVPAGLGYAHAVSHGPFAEPMPRLDECFARAVALNTPMRDVRECFRVKHRRRLVMRRLYFRLRNGLTLRSVAEHVATVPTLRVVHPDVRAGQRVLATLVCVRVRRTCGGSELHVVRDAGAAHSQAEQRGREGLPLLWPNFGERREAGLAPSGMINGSS